MPSDQTYLSWQKRLSQQPWLRRFWVFWGIYSVVIYGLLGLYFAVRPGGVKIVLLAAVAGVFTHYAACKVMHVLHKKTHPYQRLNFKPPSSRLFSFTDDVADAFPSEHSATAAAIGMVFFLFAPAVGVLSLSLAAVIGIARIILGYHDIADVFWGLLLGVICAIGCYFALHPLLFTH